MEHINAEKCVYARHHKLWLKRGKPMHSETKEEIEMSNEEMCKDCQYFERVDGELQCTATDEQFYTDDTPCNKGREEEE